MNIVHVILGKVKKILAIALETVTDTDNAITSIEKKSTKAVSVFSDVVKDLKTANDELSKAKDKAINMIDKHTATISRVDATVKANEKVITKIVKIIE